MTTASLRNRLARLEAQREQSEPLLVLVRKITDSTESDDQFKARARSEFVVAMKQTPDAWGHVAVQR